jgi:thiamine-phosphate pyrophosphorylase
MMKPLSECRLYAFVDTAYLRERTPEAVARQLCDGGADLIQLRAKDFPLEEIRRMARAILPITRAANVGLVINDYLSIAQEVGAELCHLGQENFFGAGYTRISELHTPLHASGSAHEPLERRSKLVERIGLSTHAPEQAQRALAAGADYIAIGPVFPTGTKPTAKAVTLEYVRWAAANVTTPWFAIGGINLDNLDAVLDAGAQRICVVSAILNTDDITATCLKFKARLQP